MKKVIEGKPSFSAADRLRVADLRADALSHGFVRAFAEALRVGVPGHVLAEQASISGGSLAATVNTFEVRKARFERQIVEAEGTADRAVKMAVKENRDSMRDRLTKEADAALDAADKARAGLEKLIAEAARPAPPPRPLRAYIDVLHAATTELVTRPRVSQAARQALMTVMPDFRMDPGPDGEWVAEAFVRLNVDDGVAVLGPIRWPVGFGGRGATRVRSAVELPADAKLESPTVIVRRLTEAGVTKLAAKILSTAPFRQLPYVVLHGLGAPLPSWVVGRWREPTFVKWVTGVYGNPEFDWSGYRWSQVAEVRQLVVHLAAECDGEVTSEDVRAVAPIRRSTWVLRCAVPAPEGRWNNKGRGKVATPDWQPSVVVTRRDGDDREGRVRAVGPIVCSCKRPVRVVAHVPEVPRDMLCECGLMPDAEAFAMPADLRFPEEYSALMLSKEACIAELVRALEKRLEKLPPSWSKVLASQAIGAGGATIEEISAETGISRVSVIVNELEDAGLVYYEQPGPSPLKFWYLTNRGRERTVAIGSA